MSYGKPPKHPESSNSNTGLWVMGCGCAILAGIALLLIVGIGVSLVYLSAPMADAIEEPQPSDDRAAMKVVEQPNVNPNEATAKSPATAETSRYQFISLPTNVPFDEMSKRMADNVLPLKSGEQEFAGHPFKIGTGLVQLRGNLANNADFPAESSELPVNQKFVSLHVLHSAQGPGRDGEPDHTQIGYYQLNYTSGEPVKLPIRIGEHLRDWWKWRTQPEVTASTVAWTGSNIVARRYNVTLRLYVASYRNPHPEREVESIQFVTSASKSAPFCVAMTIETE